MLVEGFERTCLLVRSPCFFPPIAREQSSSEEVFFSANYPQQGSFKGQRGSPGGLYAEQHQRNFQGKDRRLWKFIPFLFVQARLWLSRSFCLFLYVRASFGMMALSLHRLHRYWYVRNATVSTRTTGVLGCMSVFPLQICVVSQNT